MIKKIIIFTTLLLASFCIQLIQLDIRLTFGQSTVFSSLPVSRQVYSPVTTTIPAMPEDLSLQTNPSYMQEDVDIEILKEKIRQLDDPYPFVNIDKFFYTYYFDHSA